MAEGGLPGKLTVTRRQAVVRIGEWSIALTRKNRILLSFFGLACLGGLGSFCLSEFDQTRGIVNLGYSRVWLLGLCVSVFLAFWLVTGQLFSRQRWAFLLSLVVAAATFVGIDSWAPKPDQNAPPATIGGIEELLKTYLYHIKPADPQPTGPARPDAQKTPLLSGSSRPQRFKVNYLASFYSSSTTTFAGYLIESNANEVTIPDIILSLELYNLSSDPLKVSEISMEIGSDGKWFSLRRVFRSNIRRIFYTGPVAGIGVPGVADLSKAHPVWMRDLFEQLESPIQARSAVQGWAFYRYESDQFPQKFDRLRVVIHEITGEVDTDVIKTDRRIKLGDGIKDSEIVILKEDPVDVTSWKRVAHKR